MQHGLNLLPVAQNNTVTLVSTIFAFPDPLALKDTLILCMKHISPYKVLPLLASLETNQIKTLLDLGADFKIAFKPYIIDHLPNIPLSTLLLLDNVLDFHSLQITSAAEGNVSQFFKNISSAQLEFYVAHGLNLEPLFHALPFDKLTGLANKMHPAVKEWCFSHYNLLEFISHKHGAEVLTMGPSGEYFQTVINSPELPQIISSLSSVQKNDVFKTCDVNNLSHLVMHGFNLNETIHKASAHYWYNVKQFFKSVSITQLQFFIKHGLDLNHFFTTLTYNALDEITKVMHTEVKEFCFSQYQLVELIEHNHAGEVLATGPNGEYFQNIINSDTLPQTIAALNQEQTARVLKTFSNENLEHLIKHGFNLNKAIKSLTPKESAYFINKRDVLQLKFIAKHVDDLRSVIEDSFTQIRSDIINKAISASTGSCELKTKQSEINDQYLAQLAHDEARLNFYKELGVSIDTDNTIFIGFNNIHGEWSSNVIDYIKNKFQMQAKQPVAVIPLNYESTSNPHYLECFHTFINPGAGDSFLYGQHDPSAKINVGYMSHGHLLDHEQAYQNVINHAISHNKPYIGICNGNQHLILNQGGYVHRVGAPSSAQIQLIPGSITYFLALNKAEQAQGVANGFYPDKIEFDVSLAHSFAGVPEQLGKVELGGTISDGKIVEAVALSFYQVGFQFHPENRYGVCDRNANLLHNMFRMFLASKDVDMPCVNEHLSQAFKSSFEHAQCPAETVEQTVESSRDVLGEALEQCGVCH